MSAVYIGSTASHGNVSSNRRRMLLRLHAFTTFIPASHNIGAEDRITPLSNCYDASKSPRGLRSKYVYLEWSSGVELKCASRRKFKRNNQQAQRIQ